MNIRKIAWILLLAILVFFIVTRPQSAANFLQTIAGILAFIAESVATFFTAIF